MGINKQYGFFGFAIAMLAIVILSALALFVMALVGGSTTLIWRGFTLLMMGVGIGALSIVVTRKVGSESEDEQGNS